jgi:hypothetical protein
LGILACKALYTGSIPVSASLLLSDLGRLSFRAFSYRVPGLASGIAAGAAGQGTVERIAPFLVAAGSLALLAQPWISARFQGRARDSAPVLLAGLLAVTVYSGYFGAGAGVMTLSLLLVTVDPTWHGPTRSRTC